MLPRRGWFSAETTIFLKGHGKASSVCEGRQSHFKSPGLQTRYFISHNVNVYKLQSKPVVANSFYMKAGRHVAAITRQRVFWIAFDRHVVIMNHAEIKCRIKAVQVLAIHLDAIFYDVYAIGPLPQRSDLKANAVRMRSGLPYPAIVSSNSWAVQTPQASSWGNIFSAV